MEPDKNPEVIPVIPINPNSEATEAFNPVQPVVPRTADSVIMEEDKRGSKHKQWRAPSTILSKKGVFLIKLAATLIGLLVLGLGCYIVWQATKSQFGLG